MEILILVVALVGSPFQDRPSPKTVEERLKELEEKLAGLEKRHKALGDENEKLEKQIADAKAAKDAWARQSAAGWVRQYSKAAEFSGPQSAELEELWRGWHRSDLDQAPPAGAWKAREELVRSKLTAEQIPKLARAVRDEQKAAAKMLTAGWFLSAKLAADHQASFEKAVLARLQITEGALVTQAHPEVQVSWAQITGAVEGSLPELSSVLSDEERSRVQDLLKKWKSRR